MDTISIPLKPQKTPVDTTNDGEHYENLEFQGHTQESFIRSRLHKEQFGFMFVKNPLHRILSTYIDKKVGPEWRSHKETNLTQFLRQMLSHENSANEESQLFACDPCLLRISFLGKWETFKEDLAFLVNNVTRLGKAMDYRVKKDELSDYMAAQQYLSYRRMLKQQVPRTLLLKILWKFRLEYLAFGYNPFEDYKLTLT